MSNLGVATLGGYQFRLSPDAISYDYSIDYSVIDTLGGQVIQVLGATIGDITIQGRFGQDHQNKLQSWELAESFHTHIKGLIDKQTTRGNGVDISVHAPIDFSFTYRDLRKDATGNYPIHTWSMKVFIKSVQDLGGNGSIEHTSGKFSYGYVLTLFLVNDTSLSLSKVAADRFIERISKGLGWKKTGMLSSDKKTNFSFAGNDSLESAMDFIKGYSTDGTIQGYLEKLLSNPTMRPTVPATSSPPPAVTGVVGISTTNISRAQ